MTDLLEETIAAHGGRQRWAQLSSITTHTKWSGTFWALKQQPGLLSEVDMTVELHTQRVSVTPFVHDGRRGVFERDRVRIENAGGAIEEERRNPRASFAGHEVHTPWDHLHGLYFGGYTMWTWLYRRSELSAYEPASLCVENRSNDPRFEPLLAHQV